MEEAAHDLNGQTWMITGASSGIGLQITQLLLKRGAKVAAIVRSPEKLKHLSESFQSSLCIFPLDLSQTAKIKQCVQSVTEHFGDIDVVLSGAGYALVGAAEELNDADIETQLDVNLLAPIFLAKAILPYFRHRKKGKIIQISSEGGQITYPSASIYHASKWGIEGFFQSLHSEVKNFGIAVTLVEPGRVQTEFDNNAVVIKPTIEDYRRGTVGNYFRLLSMGRFPMIGDARKVAEAIIDLGWMQNPPLRVVLGSDSYNNIHRSLTEGLTELKKQENTSAKTDL